MLEVNWSQQDLKGVSGIPKEEKKCQQTPVILEWREYILQFYNERAEGQMPRKMKQDPVPLSITMFYSICVFV